MSLGFVLNNKGKTSGSRVKFINKDTHSTIQIHKPHTTGDPIKEAVLKEIYIHLIEKNLLNPEL
jgi:hypothetical protein